MDQYNARENLPSTSQLSDGEMYGFRLILFSDSDEMYDLWLPAIPEGYYRFTDSPKLSFLSLLSKNERWIATCSKPAFFQGVPLEQSFERDLHNNQLLEINCENKIYSLYIERVSIDQMVYHNYSICSDVEISIGNHPDADIYYVNPYVPRKCAVLHRFADRWSIRNCDGTVGLFVNGMKKDYDDLKIGDVICILGLRMIVGLDFLSINDGAGFITISQRILQNSTSCRGGYSYYHGQVSVDSSDSFYNRLPRKRFEIVRKTITVEGPPMSMDQKQIPLILRLGSSMVMGSVAALAGNFMTLISSVMFPFLSSKFTDKQRQEYEKLRVSKYKEYLENKCAEIENACLEEKTLLNKKYPAIHNVTNIARQKTQLWERRPVDSDFLHIRLGTGTQKLSVIIDYPARRFELKIDELEEEMYKLVESPHYVDHVPVVFSLTDTRVCGLLGKRTQVIEYIRQLVLQVATFQSYDEVKMIFFLNEEELSCMDEIRYLPHVWDDLRTIRYIATEEADAYKLGEYIKDKISEDKEGEKDLRQILKKHPYYVIFALDKKLFESHEVMKEILQSGEFCGVSIIAAYNDLPKESQNIIMLNPDQKNTFTTMSADGGEDVYFSSDGCNKNDFTEAMRVLANTRLKMTAQTQEMPKMITFLEIFKAGRIEQLNSLKRWKENDPIKSLATPVGVSTDGTPFLLDLHEKRQGPHGLVAGMTGSGKSEFLITYILSMAVNYHPDEVSFVLIDYKGGGLASAFDNPRTGVRLPHLAGTITNLDGNSIQRSLISIESELVRRQRVFNEAAKNTEEGTMNISTYQKLYRAGKVDKPMPHLFIISDEFAELKQQQPEFLEKLISAARIGRSLGVHLILATQKPSGVVNDQIRSNTKFQVCLRVQERSDSMDMIKRPDAAELTDTGRFYLQVGYNEYFALGQSAWCGADYEPNDIVTVQRDDSIELIDVTGQVMTSKKPTVRKTHSGKKQLVAIVEYLSNIASNQGFKAKSLWQPELPLLIDSEKLQKKYSKNNLMNVCIGMVDDPQNQNQFPLNIDFENVGNMLIVGQAGSGKTSIIQNIIYSLSKCLTPNDFNFYGLDYSSRLLKQFKVLPHCGDILQEEDAGLLDEFFKLINTEVYRRKKLFSDLEVDTFAEARKKQQLPLIVVFIDNFIGLSVTKTGENHSYLFNQYLKDSAVYGIKYIISCSNLRDVSSKIRQEIDTNICLYMKDKYDYADALGCKVDFGSPDIPGCGLCQIDNRPLVMQSAMLCAEYTGAERVAVIKKKIANICEDNKGQYVVQRMPVFDENAEYVDFAAQFNPRRIPLGFAKNTGKSVALPLKQFIGLGIYFGNSQGTKPILNNLLYSFQRENMEMWIIKSKKDSLFDVNNPDGIDVSCMKNADFLDCEQDNLRTLQQAMVGVVDLRTKNAKSSEDVDNKNEVPEIMLLIENGEDFSSELNPVSYLSFRRLFENAHKYGIYVLCCFQPQNLMNISKRSLQSIFMSGDVLLFGGQYDKQKLYNFGSVAGIDAELRYNLGFMVYREQIHPIIMPCGTIVEDKADADLESIF